MGILFAYTHQYALLLALLLIFFISPKPRILCFFLAGIGLALTHDWLSLARGLPEQDVINYAIIEGTIASIPDQTADKTSFNLQVDAFNGKPAQALVQLAWYTKAPPLHAGQRWQLAAKLKKPHNFNNPGSSNYVRTLGIRHIVWTGYVRPSKTVLLSNSSSWTLLSLRERLANTLAQLAKDEQTTGILQALTLNISSHLSANDWDLFRRTGTTHLFGISGEHIAMVSGLVFFLLQWLWSRSERLCLWVPAIRIASVGGFVAAFLYSLLAGFAPPVQRALTGCFFYTLCCLGKQRLSAWQIWRYALIVVTCIEPHAVFMQGFYFSFIAVACLIICQQRWPLKGFKQRLALQGSCLIGLMPLSIYWFSYGSINGFIANLFAIPLVSGLIVPLALMILLFSSWNWVSLLITPLTWLIALLFKGLLWSERLDFINISTFLLPIEYVVGMMFAGLLLVTLAIRPFKWIAMLWLLLPLIPTRSLVNRGEALIEVLDVGQGLAISVLTRHHALLYDTGDQFYKGSDLGKLVILPFYHALGIKKIDALVISHPDKDHRGGLHSVEAGIEVKQLLVNDPNYYHRGLNCHKLPSWQWDGVRFQFFPIQLAMASKDTNNSSCILQVSTSAGRALFTGDIEALAEDYLVRTYGQQLASELLIVPHHGSKTSSTYRFLMEVAPYFAIASLGHDNRFHFPHAQPLKNMSALGIEFYRTDECGMVKWKLPDKKPLSKPQCYTSG